MSIESKNNFVSHQFRSFNWKDIDLSKFENCVFKGIDELEGIILKGTFNKHYSTYTYDINTNEFKQHKEDKQLQNIRDSIAETYGIYDISYIEYIYESLVVFTIDINNIYVQGIYNMSTKTIDEIDDNVYAISYAHYKDQLLLIITQRCNYNDVSILYYDIPSRRFAEQLIPGLMISPLNDIKCYCSETEILITPCAPYLMNYEERQCYGIYTSFELLSSNKWIPLFKDVGIGYPNKFTYKNGYWFILNGNVVKIGKTLDEFIRSNMKLSNKAFKNFCITSDMFMFTSVDGKELYYCSIDEYNVAKNWKILISRDDSVFELNDKVLVYMSFVKRRLRSIKYCEL